MRLAHPGRPPRNMLGEINALVSRPHKTVSRATTHAEHIVKVHFFYNVDNYFDLSLIESHLE